MSQIDKIIAYECGELDEEGILELFQELIGQTAQIILLTVI